MTIWSFKHFQTWIDYESVRVPCSLFFLGGWGWESGGSFVSFVGFDLVGWFGWFYFAVFLFSDRVCLTMMLKLALNSPKAQVVC